MQKAALYARVSSREQAERGISIEAQLSQMYDYADRHELEIVHEYVDRGESARTADRPKFQRMIATAKDQDNPFDIILIHKTDRFARNREDAIVYKSLLKKECGVDIISITEKFDDTPQGKLLEGMMEVIAEFYSANLSQEVMKGMSARAKNGKAIGEPPYGYRINENTGTYEIYEPEAQVVRYIFNQYADGKTMQEIGIELRTNGKSMFGDAVVNKKSKAIKNPEKHADHKLTWEASSISYLLKNPVYTGEYRWNGNVLHDNHPAIVRKEKFELVQDIIEKNQTGEKNGGKDYLLRGFLRCWECGGGMTQMSNRHMLKNGPKTYRYLKCSENGRRREYCYTNTHKMDEVHERFISFLEQISEKHNFDQLDFQFVKNENLEKRLANLQSKHESFDEKFDRQMQAYESGVIDLEQLKRYKKKANQDKKETIEEIRKIKNKLNPPHIPGDEFVSRVNGVVSVLKNGGISLQDKRNALMGIVDEVRLSAKKDKMEVVCKT